MIFTKIEDASVTLCKSGLYTIHDVYECEDLLYAIIGKGYMPLKVGNQTSKPGIRWIDFDGIETKKGPVYSGLVIKK